MTDRSQTPDPSAIPALSPIGRVVLRWALRIGVVLFFVIGLLMLALRIFVLPHIDSYRDDIVKVVERNVGLPLSVERLEAEWQGLRLQFHVHGLEIGGGDEPLRLDRVEAVAGWSALLLGQPTFHQLVLVGPKLSVVREADGRIHLAGVEIGERKNSDASAADWLLRQHEIAILNASIAWEDRLREAPVLQLDDLDLRVERVAGRYRFGLQGRPGEGLAEQLDVRGDLVTDRPADPSRWNGQVFLKVDNAQLEGLTPWVDYPFPLAGQGSVDAWFGIEAGIPQSASVDFELEALGVQFEEELPQFLVPHANGRLQVVWRSDEHTVSLMGFELETAEGLSIPPTDVELRLRGTERLQDAGALRTDRADLAVLAALAESLPLPEDVRSGLQRYQPKGFLQDFRIEWHAPESTVLLSALNAHFQGVSFAAVGGMPGLEGVDGEIRGDSNTGTFTLNGDDVSADLPTIFPHSRVSLASFEANGNWARNEEGLLEVKLDQARFDNPDAAGEASGVFRPSIGRLGEIDLTARLTRAEGDAVWRYLPHVVNETTREWLRNAIVAGKVHDAQLTLQGVLEDFPFDNTDGRFLVTVDLTEGRLEYAPDWPAIDDIVASLRFEGPGLFIEASEGRIFGVQLSNVKADIPDLDAPEGPVLTLRGTAEGATADFLRFVSKSPVSKTVDGFTDDMSAEGDGVLELEFVMPLNDVDDTQVNGQFRFSDNRVDVLGWLPPLENASGTVRFSEDSFAIEEGKAQAFGQPLTITAKTVKPGHIRFDVAGGASIAALRKLHDWPGLSKLSGTAKWQAGIAVGNGATRVDIRSTLAGIAANLPEPFAKNAKEAWPLQVELEFRGHERNARGGLADKLRFEVVGREASGEFELLRGGVAVGTAVKMPEQGMGIQLSLDTLDLDEWREALDAPAPSEAGSSLVTALEADVQHLHALGYDLRPFSLKAQAAGQDWNGKIDSDVVSGGFAWSSEGDGTLALRLQHLVLGARETSDEDVSRLFEVEEDTTLPDMDVIAERFVLHDRSLGRLALQARNEAGVWLLDSLTISNSDARLTGGGHWRTGQDPRTKFALHFESSDIGRFLERIGYPEVVRDGTAQLSGELEWRGLPTKVNQATLDGTFHLEARKGRFSKLEPGVGRLLGVLSLQSLPRRLKLDFSDVFSEGFAFDRISGTGTLRAGIVSSDNLEIFGPAARVWMGGTASLIDETQDLKVVVQPTLSESVAVGAAAGLINPVAGVIAYLAQKVLSDPIERMFAYGYAITGTWVDPQVEKLPIGMGREREEESMQ